MEKWVFGDIFLAVFRQKHNNEAWYKINLVFYYKFQQNHIFTVLLQDAKLTGLSAKVYCTIKKDYITRQTNFPMACDFFVVFDFVHELL